MVTASYSAAVALTWDEIVAGVPESSFTAAQVINIPKEMVALQEHAYERLQALARLPHARYAIFDWTDPPEQPDDIRFAVDGDNVAMTWVRRTDEGDGYPRTLTQPLAFLTFTKNEFALWLNDLRRRIETTEASKEATRKAKREAEERAAYERLKAKYEGGCE